MDRCDGLCRLASVAEKVSQSQERRYSEQFDDHREHRHRNGFAESRGRDDGDDHDWRCGRSFLPSVLEEEQQQEERQQEERRQHRQQQKNRSSGRVAGRGGGNAVVRRPHTRHRCPSPGHRRCAGHLRGRRLLRTTAALRTRLRPAGHGRRE